MEINISGIREINCKEFANRVIDKTREMIDLLRTSAHFDYHSCVYSLRVPTLAIIHIETGDENTDAPTRSYLRNKLRCCERSGILCQVHRFVSQYEGRRFDPDLYNKVKDKIEVLNNDPSINGIILQLPCGNADNGLGREEGIDCEPLYEFIAAYKDVDCLNPQNVFNVCMGTSTAYDFRPCTPAGIVNLLMWSGNPEIERLENGAKRVAIIGRSNIVGKPLSLLMTGLDHTVTLCHSRTDPEELKRIINESDIVISATGYPGVVNADILTMYDKDGEKYPRKMLIDVGIHRNEDTGKLEGDVDMNSIFARDLLRHDMDILYTPVPGGVGPLTTAMVVYNTYLAWCKMWKRHVCYRNLFWESLWCKTYITPNVIDHSKAPADVEDFEVQYDITHIYPDGAKITETRLY